MIIGKWNKSVILTYVGLCISVLGIVLSFKVTQGTKYAMICLMSAGICDLFDGKIARRCKRDDSEKQFGVQLDSLVDVVNFVALPIAVFLSCSMTKWYNYAVYCLFAVFSVARLAFFNITVENSDEPIKYYRGLPVTFCALIFPVFYLLSFALSNFAFQVMFTVLMAIVSFLNIFNIKIPKPKGAAYAVFSVMFVALLAVYIIIK